MKVKRILIFLIIIVLLSLLAVFYPKLIGEVVKEEEYEKESVFVFRVIDGDTFEDDSGQSYRLLGINNKCL